jgi:hypothetical protein
MGPESKLYQKLKKNFTGFSLLRLENLSLLGTPDLLVYNNNRHFFTIELKVTKSKKVRFSPHQIAFHLRHPDNTFIIIEALGPCTPNTFPISMYHGSRIRELVTSGLKLDACYSGLEACRLALSKLRSSSEEPSELGA